MEKIVLDEDYADIWKKVRKAYNTTDYKDYPETFVLLADMENDNMRCYTDIFDFACDLESADVRKPMLKPVADVLISIHKILIEGGNTLAMNNLASFYYRGRLGEPDYKKALKYYLMATEYNEPLACTNVAYIYYYGFGVKPDYKKAYHFFMQGFLRGVDEAAYKLGDMYRYGYYVDKNPDTAFLMYYRSWDMKPYNGRVDGVKGNKAFRMADSFFEGIGVDINYNLALDFYQTAEVEFYKQIRNGDPYCQQYLEKSIKRQEECRSHIIDDLM